MLREFFVELIRKKIRILFIFLLICTCLIMLKCCSENERVERPKLDANALVLINGQPSPDSSALIKEINALRGSKWQVNDQVWPKYHPFSYHVVNLQVSNNGHAGDVFFRANDIYIEELKPNHEVGGYYTTGQMPPNLLKATQSITAQHDKGNQK